MGKVDATIPDYSVAFVESIIVAPLQPPTSLETLDRSDPNALPITSSTEETSDLAEKTVIDPFHRISLFFRSFDFFFFFLLLDNIYSDEIILTTVPHPWFPVYVVKDH